MDNKNEQIQKYISHLTESTIEMFNMMFGLESYTIENPTLTDEDIYISAIIPFGDEHFRGQMGLRTSQKTAFDLVKLMLDRGEDEHIDQETVFDGMGELANISVGHLKTIPYFLNIGFDLGVPNIVYGLGHGIEMFKAKYKTIDYINTQFGEIQLFVFMS